MICTCLKLCCARFDYRFFNKPIKTAKTFPMPALTFSVACYTASSLSITQNDQNENNKWIRNEESGKKITHVRYYQTICLMLAISNSIIFFQILAIYFCGFLGVFIQQNMQPFGNKIGRVY